MSEITEIKYFQTQVPINWGYDALRAQHSDRRKDAEPSPEVTVFCKAVLDGDVYTVTLVNADTSQPFIMYMRNVAPNFLNGTHEIQKSFFINKHEFVTNLTK